MFTKQTITKKAYETMATPEFKNYVERAKVDEDWRLHSPVHFNLKHLNSNNITTYSLILSQDYKQVRVVEHGVYNHEWGYLPLEKPVKKTVRKRRTTKTVNKTTNKTHN